MDVQGIIGFIIVTIALVSVYAYVASLVHGKIKKLGKEKSPVDQILKEVLKIEDEDEDEDELPVQKVSMPPAIKKERFVEDIVDEEKFSFHSSIESMKKRSAIEERALRISLPIAEELASEKFRKKKQETFVSKHKTSDFIFELGKKNPKAALMISYEIMSLPVSLRKTKSLWQK